MQWTRELPCPGAPSEDADRIEWPGSPSPARRAPLLGLARPSESSRLPVADHWFSAPPSPFRRRSGLDPGVFPTRADRLPKLPVPLLDLASLQGLALASICPDAEAPERPSLGFWAPRRLAPQVRFTRVCLTRHVPTSGFRPSRRFAPCGPEPIREPTAARGSVLQSLDPFDQPPPLPGSCRPAVDQVLSAFSSEDEKVERSEARLHGLAPIEEPFPAVAARRRARRAGALMDFLCPSKPPRHDGPGFPRPSRLCFSRRSLPPKRVVATPALPGFVRDGVWKISLERSRLPGLFPPPLPRGRFAEPTFADSTSLPRSAAGLGCPNAHCTHRIPGVSDDATAFHITVWGQFVEKRASLAGGGAEGATGAGCRGLLFHIAPNPHAMRSRGGATSILCAPSAPIGCGQLRSGAEKKRKKSGEPHERRGKTDRLRGGRPLLSLHTIADNTTIGCGRREL